MHGSSNAGINTLCFVMAIHRRFCFEEKVGCLVLHLFGTILTVMKLIVLMLPKFCLVFVAIIFPFFFLKIVSLSNVS